MANSGPTPVAKSTLSFWRTELDELDSHRSTPTLQAESDIVIIGAGFSGASLAHFIYDNNPAPPSVLILEAREACSGATGRNGGHLKPDLFFNIPRFAKKYGLKAAIELAEFEASQVLAVKALVEKEKIDCDFTLTRACDAILDERLADEIVEAYKEQKKGNLPYLKDVHYTPQKDAERVSGVKGAKGCFTYTAGHLWPYKLIMHLLRGVIGKGANLQTHTPVSEVSDTPLPDGRWLVKTARGSVKAKTVLFATNGYTSSLLSAFKDRIIPVRGICSRIVVPKDAVTPFLPQTYGIRQAPPDYDYLIPRNDGSIIVGGGRSPSLGNLSNWYNVSDDSKLTEPSKNYFDGLMQRHFFGWENSRAYTDRVWTGIMGYSADSMPFVGHIPGKPGQVVMAGFTGHGMPQILLTAKGVVEMLRQGKPLQHTGVPSIFKVTEERLTSQENEILNAHYELYPRSKL